MLKIFNVLPQTLLFKSHPAVWDVLVHKQSSLNAFDALVKYNMVQNLLSTSCEIKSAKLLIRAFPPFFLMIRLTIPLGYNKLSTLTNLSVLSTAIQANDQTVKKLAKEMRVRVKTAKGEQGRRPA